MLAATTIAIAAEVTGSHDHPLLTRYPQSVIEEYSQREYAQYDLPLAPPLGDKFSKSQPLEGEVTRIH
jgi:OmpA-OmpF porin, OOP family